MKRTYAGYVLVNLAACVLVFCAFLSVGGFKRGTALAENLTFLFLLFLAGLCVYLSLAFIPRESRLSKAWEPIVALLMTAGCSAIIIPVLIAARPSPSSATCKSNVRQLGLAFHMYASDFDDRLPSASAWQEALHPYTKRKAENFKCPDAESPFSYGMNSALSGIRLPEIKLPNKVVLLFECNSLSPNPRGGSSRFEKRHRGRGAVCFADSSAALILNKPGEVRWKP